MNYKKHYDVLIERSKNRERPKECIERHHVLPLCMGGSNGKDNIAILTAREHFVAHLLLACIYPRNRKLTFAVIGMASGYNKYRKGRTNNRLYGWLKEELSKCEFSLETRKKMSEAAKKKIFTREHRAKIGASQRGIPKGPASEEAKRKMSIAQKGKIRTPEYCEKMRQVKTGTNMPPVNDLWRERQRAAKLGKKPSLETMQKLSARARLKKHSQEVKDKIRASRLDKPAIAKKVICHETGVIYKSVCFAAKQVNIPATTLRSFLLGVSINNTSLKFLDY